MCGGSAPAPPPVADPAAQRQQASEDATATANAKLIANKRRVRASNNLLADLGQGLDTLGGTTNGDSGSVLSGSSSAAAAGAAAQGQAFGASVGGAIGGVVGGLYSGGGSTQTRANMAAQ